MGNFVYELVCGIPFGNCITVFTAVSLNDKSQVFVKGSRLSGKDGGNRLKQECA